MGRTVPGQDHDDDGDDYDNDVWRSYVDNKHYKKDNEVDGNDVNDYASDDDDNDNNHNNDGGEDDNDDDHDNDCDDNKKGWLMINVIDLS